VAFPGQPNGTQESNDANEPKACDDPSWPVGRTIQLNDALRIRSEQAQRGLLRDFQPVSLDFGMTCFNVLICYTSFPIRLTGCHGRF